MMAFKMSFVGLAHFMEHMNFNGTRHFPAAVKIYGIQGIPQNFLIDPQGRIVARNLRGDDLE